MTGLTFQLTTSLTASVSGRVVDESGRPALDVPSISLVRDGPTDHLAGNFSGPVAADGSFVVSRVAPGRYIAYAAETGAVGHTRFATSEVYVTGYDIDGLRLTVTPGASARGRIVFDSPNQPDFSPDSLQPFTMPRGYTQIPVGRGIGHVNEDWTFEIRGIEGQQLVRLSGLPDGWVVRAVGLAGRDITDAAIVFPTRAPTTGVQIVVTDRVTRVGGVVLDRRAEPTTDYTAVIFPANPELRTFPSRFVRAARPDQRGTFEVTGLPPADYLAYAAPAIARDAWTNPAFLEEITPAAESFSLRDGASERLNLRLQMLP